MFFLPVHGIVNGRIYSAHGVPYVYIWLLDRRVFFTMIIYHLDGKKIQILKNIALCYHDDDLCIYINFSNCTHPCLIEF